MPPPDESVATPVPPPKTKTPEPPLFFSYDVGKLEVIYARFHRVCGTQNAVYPQTNRQTIAAQLAGNPGIHSNIRQALKFTILKNSPKMQRIWHCRGHPWGNRPGHIFLRATFCHWLYASILNRIKVIKL